MIEQDIDVSLKVICVGNGQVGKTSMVKRFVMGVYTNDYKKTLAVDFLEKKMFLDAVNEEVTFLLWDTAGQEEYDAITRGYYKGAGACVIAFSTIDRDSFEAVESWYRKVTDECGQIPMCLVQNKVDLIHEAAMTPQEAEALAVKLGLKLYRTCVTENLNISEVFVYLGTEFVRRGGEAGVGVHSVTAMTTHSTPAVAGAVLQPPGEPARPQAGGTSNKPFKVGETAKPAVQRTGGKKHRLFTNCTIL